MDFPPSIWKVYNRVLLKTRSRNHLPTSGIMLTFTNLVSFFIYQSFTNFLVSIVLLLKVIKPHVDTRFLDHNNYRQERCGRDVYLGLDEALNDWNILKLTKNHLQIMIYIYIIVPPISPTKSSTLTFETNHFFESHVMVSWMLLKLIEIL